MERHGSFLNSVIDDTFFVVCKNKGTSKSYVGRTTWSASGFNKQDPEKKIVSIFIVADRSDPGREIYRLLGRHRVPDALQAHGIALADHLYP